MRRMSRARAPIRQPSSSRGGWLAHQKRGSPAALRGSEADPTGFHLDAAHQAAQNGVYEAFAAWHRSAFGDTHAQLGRGASVASRSRPQEALLLTRTPARGVYLQLSIPVPQMRSGLPSYVPPSAQDSWQVLMCEGKSRSQSRAFTILLKESVL